MLQSRGIQDQHSRLFLGNHFNSLFLKTFLHSLKVIRWIRITKWTSLLRKSITIWVDSKLLLLWTTLSLVEWILCQIKVGKYHWTLEIPNKINLFGIQEMLRLNSSAGPLLVFSNNQILWTRIWANNSILVPRLKVESKIYELLPQIFALTSIPPILCFIRAHPTYILVAQLVQINCLSCCLSQ